MKGNNRCINASNMSAKCSYSQDIAIVNECFYILSIGKGFNWQYNVPYKVISRYKSVKIDEHRRPHAHVNTRDDSDKPAYQCHEYLFLHFSYHSLQSITRRGCADIHKLNLFYEKLSLFQIHFFIQEDI